MNNQRTVEAIVGKFRTMRELHERDKTGDRLAQECFWFRTTLETERRQADERLRSIEEKLSDLFAATYPLTNNELVYAFTPEDAERYIKNVFDITRNE